MRRLRLWFSRGLTVGLTAVAAAAPSAGKTMDLVIADVTVIDPRLREVLPGRWVYVDRGRIRAVEASESTRHRAKVVVDGRDRFLIPGLIDAHVHLNAEGVTEESVRTTLALLLANGVTGVRDMAADCWEPRSEGRRCRDDMRRLDRRIGKGELAGPRLLAMSSGIVRGEIERGRLPEGAPAFFAPQTADEGHKLARYLAKRGVDIAKTYNSVSREAYFALLEGATRRGLEVSGHLPLGVSVAEASAAGHRTIEHARDLPLACSRYGEEYRKTMDGVVERRAGVDPPDAETRLRRTLATQDEALCDEVLARLARNGTILVPTHGTREMDARAADPDYRDDPRLAYVAAALREKWDRELDNMAAVAPRLGALYLEFYELGLALSVRAHAAGVRVLVGTDTNDTMIVPGFAIHDEIGRLVSAGIEPMDVLNAATSESAEVFGRAEDLGAIEVGYRAELVLLQADPLTDIGNTRRIEAVVSGGRIYARPGLDALLESARASSKSPAREQP